MYGPALPGHLGAVLTAELLNNSSHLFEFFIAFAEEVAGGGAELLYWKSGAFKKHASNPNGPPAERCAERFFLLPFALWLQVHGRLASLSFYCVLTGARLCQAGYLVASQRCQKLNSLHLFGRRQKRI